MVVLRSGNVGIGTASPGGKLHVSGNVIVKDTFVVQDTMLVVKESGNVGIGTAGPSDILDVRMASGNNTSGLTISSPNNSGTGSQPSLYLKRYSSGTLSTTARILSGQAGTTTSDLCFQTGTSGSPNSMVTRLYIDSGGSVGIGTDTPTNPLQMASGAYVSTGGVWTNASSRSYKENINDLSGTEAHATVMALRPQRYNYKLDKDDRHVGFIAEDVPELVATKDRKGISAMDIVAVLTKVVQEQQAQIETLTKKVETLEGAR